MITESTSRGDMQNLFVFFLALKDLAACVRCTIFIVSGSHFHGIWLDKAVKGLSILLVALLISI